MELVGRPSLVIGGGSGVGRGIALAFAEVGAPVIVADRDLVAARETAVAAGAEAVAVEVDATSRSGSRAIAYPRSGCRRRDRVQPAQTVHRRARCIRNRMARPNVEGWRGDRALRPRRRRSSIVAGGYLRRGAGVPRSTIFIG